VGAGRSFASSCHLRRCDASAGPPKPASQTNGKVCEDLWPMSNKHAPNGDDRVNTGGSMSDADTATLGAEIWRDCDEAR
jgi:hypothetical protein